MAQDQLAVMRNIEIRQLRAYLTVDHGPLMMTDTSAGAEIRIQHAGLTPAHKVRLDAAVEVAPYYPTATKLGDPFTMAGRQSLEYVVLYGTEPIKSNISLPPGSFDATRLVRSSDPGNRWTISGSIFMAACGTSISSESRTRSPNDDMISISYSIPIVIQPGASRLRRLHQTWIALARPAILSQS